MADTMATPDPAASMDQPEMAPPAMPNAEMPAEAPTEAAPADAAPEEMPKPGPEANIGEPPKGNEIKKIADSYVIPISDEAIKKWQKVGPEEFKKYAEQVAVGMYPTFAPQIQAGMTVDVLLDPYVEVAKQVLGPVMGEPNWSDPKWSAALQGSVDP